MKSAIVLAAGKGTRMKSSKNKVMHEVMGKPMIGHVVSRLEKLNVDNIVVVVGHQADEIEAYLQQRVAYALQQPQLGTGHAVMQACIVKGSRRTDIDSVRRLSVGSK
jgi:bifunctional UDP-N-acetylglucosamine pyrophosphorylase / glucosamine-1-phosphate N-acetyltransferase